MNKALFTALLLSFSPLLFSQSTEQTNRELEQEIDVLENRIKELRQKKELDMAPLDATKAKYAQEVNKNEKASDSINNSMINLISLTNPYEFNSVQKEFFILANNEALMKADESSKRALGFIAEVREEQTLSDLSTIFLTTGKGFSCSVDSDGRLTQFDVFLFDAKKVKKIEKMISANELVSVSNKADLLFKLTGLNTRFFELTSQIEQLEKALEQSNERYNKSIQQKNEFENTWQDKPSYWEEQIEAIQKE